MSPSSIDVLVDFTHSTARTELPSAIVRRATDLLADALACAIGGRDCLAARAAERFPSAPREPELGRVIGFRAFTPPDLAAFWNTAMIRYLDYNDACPGGHPSDMLGTITAVARLSGASGMDVLRATVIAYEIYIRLAEVVNLRPPRTIDQGYGTVIGATAAACALLGLSADAIRHAIGMAASSGVPLRSTRAGQLSDYKGVATAISSRNAVFFALLARDGMTGPADPFDGRHGIVELLEGAAGPLELRPFDRWDIMSVRQKYWPVAYNMQPSIWAAIQLRDHVAADQVERVQIFADSFSWHESGSEPEKWHPTTRETADHSLPFVFAHALRYGRVDADAFQPSGFRDAVTVAMMQKIAVIETPDAEPLSVRVEAVDSAGGRHQAALRAPLGHEDNPFGEADLAQKFLTLTRPVLGETADKALQSVLRTADAEDFDDVLTALIP